MEGLTFQGELDNYWQAALEKKPNSQLHSRFRNYLIRHTQLNGNFYKRLNIPGSNTGLDWGNRLPDQVARPEGDFMTASSTRPEIRKQRAFK
jgi:capsular polysaccharide export protein